MASLQRLMHKKVFDEGVTMCFTSIYEGEGEVGVVILGRIASEVVVEVVRMRNEFCKSLDQWIGLPYSPLLLEKAH